MQFNIHEAKTYFSKLVAAVEAGKKVVICRNGTPIIECIPVPPPARRRFEVVPATGAIMQHAGSFD